MGAGGCHQKGAPREKVGRREGAGMSGGREMAPQVGWGKGKGTTPGV